MGVMRVDVDGELELEMDKNNCLFTPPLKRAAIVMLGYNSHRADILKGCKINQLMAFQWCGNGKPEKGYF